MRVRVGRGPGSHPGMDVRSLDHIALWTSEREADAALLIEGCGMHEIERTDDFTLVGGDARRGKLTLFDADGPRERGAIAAVGVRVTSLDEVRGRLASRRATLETTDHGLVLEAPSGLRLSLVEGGNAAPDLDHVVLEVGDPEATAAGLEAMGLDRRGDELGIADTRVLLEAGGAPTKRPLLNHLGLLVEDTHRAEVEAREQGLTIDRVVDAENTRAVFVEGPDGIVVEYVEHKPGFSLA